MANVFKKLIRKEFGENNYYKYFFSYQNLLYNNDYDTDELENDEVYKDIYDNLKEMDTVSLVKKQARLSDTMMIALSISKSYLMIFATYILAIWILVTQDLQQGAATFAIVGISISFLYKTYEFIVNKFCYVDAHIVIIYKSVLDKLLDDYKEY